MVCTPYSASTRRVFSPTPHSRADGQRRQERRLLALRHDHQPVGLAQVRRDLGHEPGRRDADGRRQPELVPDGAPDRRGRSRSGGPWSASVPATSRNASSMEICSTSGVKRRRMVMTCAAHRAVLAPVDGHEHPVRAQRTGGPQGHRGAHAEAAGLVGGRADDAAVVGSAATDDDRPAPKLGPVPLLDGREERVEIDVEDGRAGHGGAILRPVRKSDGDRVSPWARPRS